VDPSRRGTCTGHCGLADQPTCNRRRHRTAFSLRLSSGVQTTPISPSNGSGSAVALL